MPNITEKAPDEVDRQFVTYGNKLHGDMSIPALHKVTLMGSPSENNDFEPHWSFLV